MSTQEQRERFEAAQRPKTDLAKNRRGDYTNPVVQHCWGTWRAAEAAAIERCAEMADMVRSKFSSSGHIQQAAGAWCVHEELRNLLPKEE